MLPQTLNSQFERKRWKVHIKKMGIIQGTLNAAMAIRCVNNRISEYHEDPPSSLTAYVPEILKIFSTLKSKIGSFVSFYI